MKKQNTLKLLLLFCFVSLLAALIPAAAFADGFEPDLKYAKTITMCKTSTDTIHGINFSKYTKNAKKVTVKSSNWDMIESYYNKEAADYGCADVTFVCKKTGTATVTIKVTYKDGTKKSYPIKTVIKKYVNPFESLKIGTKEYKTSIRSSLYSQKDYLLTGSPKVSYKLKKNWKLTKLVFSYYDDNLGKEVRKTLKNGSRISFGSLTDTYGMILAKVKNTSTGMTETIHLYLHSNQ